MDFTSRMLSLLTAVRRERNGEVADTMRYYGMVYGLNYGVSLPTLRNMVRAEASDHEFAKYLYVQDVRELRLAALWIADPDSLTVVESPFWGVGIINSEVAEEAAFALLSRSARLDELFDAWTAPGQPSLLAYAVLLGAARNPRTTIDCLDTVVELVRRHLDDRLIAQGVVALLSALGQKKENRPAIRCMIGSLDTSPSADLIHEETVWRLES